MGRRATLNAKKRNRRIITISVVVAIIAAVVILTLIVQSSQNNPYSSFIGKPVSSSVLQAMTGISDSTLSTIGAPSGVSPPNAISGPALTSGGKPEVVYIGGDYCPYCAFERWSLIIALSRFGIFSGLEYMQSSSTDVNPSSPTFTFTSATYTSQYIAFLPIEEYDRSGNPIKTLTTDQQALITNYDTCPSTGTNGGIPFVDIANSYAVACGAQSAMDLSGQNWTAIASQLSTASSPTAQQIDGAANALITAICKVDGGQPATVCTQSYATLTLAYTSAGASPTGQGSLSLITQVREEARWSGLASRF
ncbi:MAG: DUF929 family protein [Nitrososphaerales archaeon]|jgi:hypothetical protein